VNTVQVKNPHKQQLAMKSKNGNEPKWESPEPVYYDSSMTGTIKQNKSPKKTSKTLQESERSMKRGLEAKNLGIEPYWDIWRERSNERVEVQILELTDEDELSQIEQAIEKQMSQEEIV